MTKGRVTNEGGESGGHPEAPADPSRGGDAFAAERETFYCDLCGNEMLNLHCKLICERCGYKRDCSDP